jgi:hypothetical protein
MATLLRHRCRARISSSCFPWRDNAVFSRSRNPDGSWSDEQRVAGIFNGDPIAADVVAATTNYVIVLMLWGPPQPPSQTKWLSTLTGPDLGNALTMIAGRGYFRLLAQYNAKQVTTAGNPTQLATRHGHQGTVRLPHVLA